MYPRTGASVEIFYADRALAQSFGRGETGRPWTDKYNPDPAQRGRALVGASTGLGADWI